MFHDKISKEYIVSQLTPVIAIFEKQVIPSQVALLDNNSYTVNYAWMYSFEKRLKYRIEDLLGSKLTYNQERVLFGAGGVVAEGLSNAFVHGHKKNMDLPLTVWVSTALKGLGFVITDSGSGFDFNEIYMRYKKGIPYYNVAGNGFPLLYNSKEILACYREHGTQLCLLCPFMTKL